MEKMLQKLAEKLNSCDEASLMSLWNKYNAAVQNFKTGKDWEEAVLILSMIQGVRWKNQLFNYHWGQQYRPVSKSTHPKSGPDTRSTPKQDSKILTFRPPKKS